MRDATDARLWADHHQQLSDHVGRRLGQATARFRAGEGDPLPIVGRAMAIVLAVSLTSLSLSTLS
jgi:hypothetical protein